MKTNSKIKYAPVITHEGGPAVRTSVENQLRRSVMACMLWENEFYEDGVSIAQRISDLCEKLPAEIVADIAIEARKAHNLRHVPLLLLCELAKKGGSIVGDTIAAVISRADELAELLAIYWKDGRKPISKQMKIGLARAFHKFDEYQFAKYNRDGQVKLRDVMFMVHPKPKNQEQKELFDKIATNSLAIPDTWEVALSAGADKKETFTRLIQEKNLGYLALLRNLRNMDKAGVDRNLIRKALMERRGAERVLPFRFTAAANAAPSFARMLDDAMQISINKMPLLKGTTLVFVDVSGSMDCKLSAKSDLTRMQAASTLAACINAEDLRVFSFSTNVVEVKNSRGLAGVEAIIGSQPNRSTQLKKAMKECEHIPRDRIIVITDEQSQDGIGEPLCDKAYMINVASYRNGVGYGKYWIHIDGFSENVIRYISEMEE